MERIKLKLNILLEISTTTKGPEADKVLDIIEKNCKANELFIVDWQRQGDKIRIYSKFSEIIDAIETKRLTPKQLELIQYKRIEN